MRYSKEWGHGENEQLTVSRMEGIMASGKALKARVDGGGGWIEKWGMGEGESEQSVTKTKN